MSSSSKTGDKLPALTLLCTAAQPGAGVRDVQSVAWACNRYKRPCCLQAGAEANGKRKVLDDSDSDSDDDIPLAQRMKVCFSALLLHCPCSPGVQFRSFHALLCLTACLYSVCNSARTL